MTSHNDRKVRKSFAGIFKLLGYSCAVDSIFPVFFCTKFRNERQSFFDFNLLSQESSFFSHDLSYFLDSITIETSNPAHSLFCYCVDFVLAVHCDDISPEPALKIPGTYNPPKYGRAYYFTDHGHQVRQMRRFPIDKKIKHGQIYDDAPDTRCEKRFHFLRYLKKVCRTFFSGSARNMGIAMDTMLFQNPRDAKTQLPLCIFIWKKPLKQYCMTLLAVFLSTSRTEKQCFTRKRNFTMTTSTALHINVRKHFVVTNF